MLSCSLQFTNYFSYVAAPNFSFGNKDLLAESWRLDIGYWNRASSFSLTFRPENNVSRAADAYALASRLTRQSRNCADSLCAVPTGVNAVMSGKSYDEFMEDVYA